MPLKLTFQVTLSDDADVPPIGTLFEVTNDHHNYFDVALTANEVVKEENEDD